jgi:RNA polymerase sigma-70 factor (ECF subfamily)
MNNTDEELIKKIASGDRVAFATLLEKYKSMVFGFSVRMINDRTVAEEIAQETWMRVVEHADSFQGRSKVTSWILAICRNLALDELKKQNHHQSIDDDGNGNSSDNLADKELSALVDEQPLAEQLITTQQDVQKLKFLIAELPDKQRVALVMTMSDDETPQSELAQQMGITVNAFKVLVHKAKENIKTKWSIDVMKGGKNEIK